jgi:hypothetical protein
MIEMKEENKKLYNLFYYGYKPEDIAKILNIPVNLIDNAYKEWLKLKKELGIK